MEVSVKTKENELDELIRAGKLVEAKTLLFTLESSFHHDPLLSAQFLRRLNENKRALLVLRPGLFSLGEVVKNPDPAFQVEYALNLSQLGLTREALLHLDQVKEPSVSFFQARGFVHLKQMEFARARGEFEQALRQKTVSEYQRFVFRANILNCYVGELAFLKATSYGEKLLIDLESTEFSLLKTYVHQALSQAAVFLNEQKRFLFYSEQAFSLAKIEDGTRVLDGMSLELMRGRWVGDQWFRVPSKIKIESLCQAAMGLQDFETFRDLCIFREWFMAKQTRDWNGLERSLSGCSVGFFQNRIEKISGKNLKLKLSSVDHLSWFYSPDVHFKSRVREFSLLRDCPQLKPGQVPYRLLAEFLKEHFRPLTVTELFQALYPETQYFHPTSSPNLVHQAVRRLNRILGESKIPIQIISQEDRYRVEVEAPFTLELEVDLALDPWIEKVRVIVGQRQFSSDELAKKLDVTRRSVQLLLKKYSAHFRKSKRGRDVNYRLRG